MKAFYSLMFAYSFTLTSCGQTINKKEVVKKKHFYTNHLIHESSPYLLQHAHNPVNWYPWGKQAIEKAKQENKLILISIGYAACHWCHVMEHESYEDEAVAKLMNEHFICIKVDREERPDIDQVYLDAVQLLTGSGGWPLNCIALPDGRPIYGGTYFPKKQWINVLRKVYEFVKEHPDKAEKQAEALTKGVQAKELSLIKRDTSKTMFTKKKLDKIFNFWQKRIDYTHGGTKGAPKFPLPIGYQFLLHYHYLTQNKSALQAVTTTLEHMAKGGIYDQIGGGLSRYSTDEYWRVPHFEKMLYDNAQLVSLYAKAYQATHNLEYKKIVKQTLNFVQHELTSEDGGFYSSLDADSQGEEGKFYLWRKSEIKQLLGEEASLINDYYNVEERGNWEKGENILYRSISDNRILSRYHITEKTLWERVEKAQKKLQKAREKRIKPRLDDKILTSWNALMLKAYVDAYRVFNQPAYLNAALKNAHFIESKIKQPDGRLYRNYKNNKPSINGFLDDYAFVIQSFIYLYQATFNEKWLKEARQLTEYTLVHFYDQSSGIFHYNSNLDPSLIARKTEIADNVIPASNSQMAQNLYLLGQYFYQASYIEKAKNMLQLVKEKTEKGGTYYANWDILMAWFASPPYEVAIVGKDFKKIQQIFDKNYLPNVFLSGGKNEGTLALLKDKLVPGQTTIYVCKKKVCNQPTTRVEEALKQIGK